jgi:hypothetical protein
MPALRNVFTALAAAALSVTVHAAAIVPPSITAGFTNTANQTSPLGSNISSPTDYTREYPFINHFKMARPWFPSNGTQFSCRGPNPALPACNSTLLTFNQDARGNITSLKTNQLARSVIFTGAPADPAMRNKLFNFFFDGDGDFDFSNVQSATRIGPNQYQIKTRQIADADLATNELTVIITMTRNNPQNPVKNVRLLPPGGICASNPLATVAAASACPLGDFKSFRNFHQSIVFNPAFLNQIKTYRSLRFMDWMKTNNSLTQRFATRPVPLDQFWNSDDSFNDVNDPNNCNMITRGCKGVPLEVMIALANLMDMDPWLNIPHMATVTDTTVNSVTTESYVKQFAKLLNEQLEPGRKAYIEYSNEVWNFQFAQSSFAFDQANSCGTTGTEVCPEFETSVGIFGGGSDPGSAFVRFYSKRAQQVFAVFDEVMGAERPNKIRRVMATQAVNPYFTDQILDFQQGASLTDVFAVAPYFGDTVFGGAGDEDFFYAGCLGDPVSGDVSRRQAFVNAGVEGVIAWLQNSLTSPVQTTATSIPDLGYGSFPCVMSRVREQAEVAAGYGIPLTTYEGGQHFLMTKAFASPADAPEEVALIDNLNALFDAVNRDPRMSALYLSYLTRWRVATNTNNTLNNGRRINAPLVAPNGAMFHHFVNSDSWSPFGRWGAKEFPTQTSSPKFKGIQSYIAQKPLTVVPGD